MGGWMDQWIDKWMDGWRMNRSRETEKRSWMDHEK